MKLIAINGSPRKKWNTATLLEEAVKGAAALGADTRLIHLYDLDFKGCMSCFACKRKGGKNLGRCAINDDLTPVLAEIASADAVILGSPIYFGTASGEMRSFMERLFFPYLSYSQPPRSLFPRKINAGLIYTMNVTEAQMKMLGQEKALVFDQMAMGMIFGASESLFSFDTCQFKDYSKMEGDFDPEAKARTREELFPLDCAKAFDMGARFARKEFTAPAGGAEGVMHH